MANQAPFPADRLEAAERVGASFICRVMAKAPDGSPGVIAHYFGTHSVAMEHASALMRTYPGAWIEGLHLKRPASESVTLADGAADQSLIPGVAAVPLTARQLAQERARREARRGAAGLPCGGLWDETAINQGSLF